MTPKEFEAQTGLFVVVRSGVYDQGVVGVHTTLEAAKQTAEQAAELEEDCYHDFEIRRQGEGSATGYRPTAPSGPLEFDVVVAELRARDENNRRLGRVRQWRSCS